MELPKTHYARSGEIVIAYQVHGEGEHDLVFSGTTASNVETVWALPEAHAFFERLGRFSRVIRFDRRDTGVSDPIRDDLTLEAHAADALAVMDAVGSERPMLLGGADGARSLAALAATQPERVGGLIGVAPTARGVAAAAPGLAEELIQSIVDLEWPARVVDIWAPDWADDPVRRDRLERYIRTSVTPRQAERSLRMSMTSDISEVLPLVQCPTLVLWPRDGLIPEEPVREFTQLVPGATFREIPGNGMLLYRSTSTCSRGSSRSSSPAPRRARSPAASWRPSSSPTWSPRPSAPRRRATAAWTDTLTRHHAAATAAIDAHGGELVKTMGDGVLATFAGPAQGVRCAERIIADARAAGLDVRSGLHTGEVERGGDDVAGLAVHLAARIMGLAQAGDDPRLADGPRPRRRQPAAVHRPRRAPAQGHPRAVVRVRRGLGQRRHPRAHRLERRAQDVGPALGLAAQRVDDRAGLLVVRPHEHRRARRRRSSRRARRGRARRATSSIERGYRCARCGWCRRSARPRRDEVPVAAREAEHEQRARARR